MHKRKQHSTLTADFADVVDLDVGKCQGVVRGFRATSFMLQEEEKLGPDVLKVRPQENHFSGGDRLSSLVLKRRLPISFALMFLTF